MSLIRGRIYNRVKKAHGGDRKSEKSRAQSDPLKTADLLSQTHHVSSATIKRDGQFAEFMQIMEKNPPKNVNKKGEFVNISKPILPKNEGQIRPLIEKLEHNGERIEVWARAVDTGEKITAELVQTKVDEFLASIGMPRKTMDDRYFSKKNGKNTDFPISLEKSPSGLPANSEFGSLEITIWRSERPARNTKGTSIQGWTFCQ